MTTSFPLDPAVRFLGDVSPQADLDLAVTPEPRAGATSRVGASVARFRRAFGGGAVGSRARLVEAGPGVSTPTPAPAPAVAPAAPSSTPDALVVPAGSRVRGFLRARTVVVAGDVTGEIHCTAGPVVIRAGATLRGRLVAQGDVVVQGTVIGDRASIADGGEGASAGGPLAAIATRGRLTLAPGARVVGDVRSGTLHLHDGSSLRGLARAFED